MKQMEFVKEFALRVTRSKNNEGGGSETISFSYHSAFNLMCNLQILHCVYAASTAKGNTTEQTEMNQIFSCEHRHAQQLWAQRNKQN